VILLPQNLRDGAKGTGNLTGGQSHPGNVISLQKYTPILTFGMNKRKLDAYAKFVFEGC
jgi:hypothetical protein